MKIDPARQKKVIPLQFRLQEEVTVLHYARKLTSSFKNARYLTNFYPKPS